MYSSIPALYSPVVFRRMRRPRNRSPATSTSPFATIPPVSSQIVSRIEALRGREQRMRLLHAVWGRRLVVAREAGRIARIARPPSARLVSNASSRSSTRTERSRRHRGVRRVPIVTMRRTREPRLGVLEIHPRRSPTRRAKPRRSRPRPIDVARDLWTSSRRPFKLSALRMIPAVDR